LSKTKIALRSYLPSGSSNLQLQVVASGSTFNLLSNGLSSVRECDGRQTDRQTDHAMDKCVGIGGIACAAREIPPNNWKVRDDVGSR